MLVFRGADPNVKGDDGRKPMSFCVADGFVGLVSMLLDRDAEPDSKDKNGRTPLSWAAENGHKEVVEKLLDKGADPDSEDNYKQTPLSRAVDNEHTKVVKLLLKAPIVNSNARNSTCRNALMIQAAKQNKWEIVGIFLAYQNAKLDFDYDDSNKKFSLHR